MPEQEFCHRFNQSFINIDIFIVNKDNDDFSACLTQIWVHGDLYQTSFKFSNIDTIIVLDKNKEANLKKAMVYVCLSIFLWK